jgi:hypothetical protein
MGGAQVAALDEFPQWAGNTPFDLPRLKRILNRGHRRRDNVISLGLMSARAGTPMPMAEPAAPKKDEFLRQVNGRTRDQK